MRGMSLPCGRDPLGRMLLDYLDGEKDAVVDVFSDTVEMWAMSGRVMFRTWQDMDALERKALSLCSGVVLDVGAGSGCHTLYLQDKGLQCWAMDISPGCIEVMQKRNVERIICDDIFHYHAKRFDTILLMMNGLGIADNIPGLEALLRHLDTLLLPGGCIIADSTDLSMLFDEDGFDYSSESYSGEVDFVMQYKDVVSEPFIWLYIDFESLRNVASAVGLQCRQLMICDNGRYLVKMWK